MGPMGSLVATEEGIEIPATTLITFAAALAARFSETPEGNPLWLMGQGLEAALKTHEVANLIQPVNNFIMQPSETKQVVLGDEGFKAAYKEFSMAWLQTEGEGPTYAERLQ